MDKNILNNFIDGMKEAMYQLGEMALEHQGKVINSRKQVEDLSSDNDFIKQERMAKTIIDEKVQEGLLLVASKLLDASYVYLDAEEETPSKEKFSPEPTATTLVIDPLDGTLRYLLGKDGFSICVGLIKKGDMLTSLVYFPARKEFYFIKDGKVYCEANKEIKELFAPKVKKDNKIFMNIRASAQLADSFIKQGFDVIDDANGVVSWPDALIGCIKGEYSACIFHTPQIRDVLLGAMISKISGGYALDWAGHEIIWPNGGRIPHIMFGFKPLPEKALLAFEGEFIKKL
ncbi:MAG: inositol monophosphatase family protein [bacterium]